MRTIGPYCDATRLKHGSVLALTRFLTDKETPRVKRQNREHRGGSAEVQALHLANGQV